MTVLLITNYNYWCLCIRVMEVYVSRYYLHNIITEVGMLYAIRNRGLQTFHTSRLIRRLNESMRLAILQSIINVHVLWNVDIFKISFLWFQFEVFYSCLTENKIPIGNCHIINVLLPLIFISLLYINILWFMLYVYLVPIIFSIFDNFIKLSRGSFFILYVIF